jgi:hypothetical protein
MLMNFSLCHVRRNRAACSRVFRIDVQDIVFAIWCGSQEVAKLLTLWLAGHPLILPQVGSPRAAYLWKRVQKGTGERGQTHLLPRFPPVPEFGEIIKGIDRFYQEPENLRVVLFSATKVFAMKVEGATATEIEAAMDRARNYANNPQPKAPPIPPLPK